MTLTWIAPNDTFLTNAQQMNNAQLVATHFVGTDWTKESLSALIGNMAHESSLNPSMHELGYGDSPSRGYGLVQWTPMTKYTDWASANGLDYTSGDSQLARIDYEVTNDIQWVANGYQVRYGMGTKYNFSFADFRKNVQGLSVNDLTEAFMWNYEGPALSAGQSSLSARQSFANQAYTGLDWTGTGGGTGGNPPPTTDSGLIPLLLSDALFGWR
jgi:hypothetical protein